MRSESTATPTFLPPASTCIACVSHGRQRQCNGRKRHCSVSASPPHAHALIQWRGTSAQSRASMSGLSWLSFPGLGGPSATTNFKRGERWDGREFIKISLKGAETSREAKSTVPAMLNRARRGRAHRRRERSERKYHCEGPKWTGFCGPSGLSESTFSSDVVSCLPGRTMVVVFLSSATSSARLRHVFAHSSAFFRGSIEVVGLRKHVRAATRRPPEYVSPRLHPRHGDAPQGPPVLHSHSSSDAHRPRRLFDRGSWTGQS